MLKGNDNSEELVQAVRTIQKDQRPSSIPPPDPDDIFYLDCNADPATTKPFILWEDILQAFPDVVQVRHKARMLPFMKGPDFRTLEPWRIAAIANAVLDIVLSNPLVATDVTSSGGLQQESVSPTLQGEGEETSKERTVSQEATTAVSTRPNPAHAPEDEAMDNYTNNDDTAFVPISQAPQLIPDTEPPASNTESESTKTTMDLAQLTADANLGDNAAQVSLGDRYRKGDGVDQDYQTAMEWYLKAAAQGNADAQNNIGQLYDEEHGVPLDYAQAVDWYLKAAEQGHIDAQNSVGNMYEEGDGILQDYSQAMDWYLKAADQGHDTAQNNIGRMYEKGKGVAQDYSQAMDWFLKAAEQDHPTAQFNIGGMYEKGKGVTQDYSRAVVWYLKAAEQGHTRAQYDISELFENGQAKDIVKAKEWYQKAAEQGQTHDQYDISELFEKGQGVPEDIVKTKEWYQKIANQGSSRANEALKRKKNYNAYSASASGSTSDMIVNYTHTDDRPYSLRKNH